MLLIRPTAYRGKIAVVGAIFASILFVASAHAQVKPGDLITAETANKVKDLVPPGVYYKVEKGMSMKVVPAERCDWPPPYRDATEKYSAQVRLTDDHRSVLGYVAGQPFPLLDPNDPTVATKIIWNNVFRPITTDDYDLRFYDCDTAMQSKGPQTKQVEYFQIGHYAGYGLVAAPRSSRCDRSGFQEHRPLLAVRAVPGARAAGYARSGFIRYRYPMPVTATTRGHGTKSRAAFAASTNRS